MADVFEVLGLTPEATPADIKRRWHTLALQHHPDHGGDPEQFQALTAAYREALALAQDAPCAECRGRGTVPVGASFNPLLITCDTCGGTGKRAQS